jgi:hypothetical protein
MAAVRVSFKWSPTLAYGMSRSAAQTFGPRIGGVRANPETETRSVGAERARVDLSVALGSGAP